MCVKGQLFYWGPQYMAAIINTIIILLSLWPKALILGRGNSSGPHRLTDPGLISAAGPGKASSVVDDGQLRASGTFPNSSRFLKLPVGTGVSWPGTQPSAVMSAGRQVGV